MHRHFDKKEWEKGKNGKEIEIEMIKEFSLHLRARGGIREGASAYYYRCNTSSAINGA